MMTTNELIREFIDWHNNLEPERNKISKASGNIFLKNHKPEFKNLDIPLVSGSVLSDSEIEEYIWEEIELPLCETDRILNTDNYKRYLEAVKWAKFGRDERTDR